GGHGPLPPPIHPRRRRLPPDRIRLAQPSCTPARLSLRSQSSILISPPLTPPEVPLHRLSTLVHHLERVVSRQQHLDLESAFLRGRRSDDLDGPPPRLLDCSRRRISSGRRLETHDLNIDFSQR